MTCPDLDWLILSNPEKIMMLFSLFEILLLPNLLVFWRSRVNPIINLLVLTGLILVDFVWLRRLSCRVLQGWLTTYSQLEILPPRWKTAKVNPLFKKGDASDPSNYRPIFVVTVLSILWRLLNVTSTILCMTFFNWTTWFILDSPVFVQHGF